LAQDERERILKRSKDGLKHAKARGVHCGRPRALNYYQREAAARRLAEGESARSVARLLGVSHVTVTKLRVASGPVDRAIARRPRSRRSNCR